MKKRPNYIFKPNSNAKYPVCIHKHPEKDTKYSLGVDAATGFGDDFTSLSVYSNRIPFEEVAWFRSKHVNTVDGSKIMVELGRYFNDATLVIEIKFPGNAYCDNAIEVYNYPKIYQSETHNTEDYLIKKRYGIATTEEWKHLLVNKTKDLLELHEHPQVIFNDLVGIDEIMQYAFLTDSEKMGAQIGANDDTVVSKMLALWHCCLFPQQPKTLKQRVILTEDQAHKQYLLDRHMARITGKNQLQPV